MTIAGRTAFGRHCRWAPAVAWLVAAAALGETPLALAQAALPDLSGTWKLQEAAGDLPDQAVRALDGPGAAAASGRAIAIAQTADGVTVYRGGTGGTVLRVMRPGRSASREMPGGLAIERVEWRDGALVLRGELTVKQGFVKRRVPVEEEWTPDANATGLTVTTRLETPLGVKTRRQVYVREIPGGH